MTETEVLAPEAGATPEPEAVEAEKPAVEETEGQPEPEQAAEGEEKPEELTESQKRRARKRAEVDRLRASEEDVKRRLETIRQAAQGEVEPKRELFADPDEYIAAKAAWNGSQAYMKREASNVEAESNHIAQQRQAGVAAMWQEQVAAAKTAHADFEQVAFTAPISDQVAEIVQLSEHGAEIAYHLGTHRAEAVRLSQMHPLDAALEIGRLQATIAAPKPKTETGAPAPITPVSGGKVSRQVNPDKMSMDEYRKARQAGTIK